MLFVHPALGWSYTYGKHISQLSNDFRCVAFDFPGFGLSQPSEKYFFTLSEQARILEQFVKRLNLDNMIVWANDGGGPSTILGLASISQRVTGLVVGGTFGWSLNEYPSVSRMIGLFSSPMFRFLNRYLNLFAQSIRFALGTHSPSKIERLHYVMPFKKRNSRSRPLKLFKTFIDPKMGEELNKSIAAFRDKALLIQFGEKDRATSLKWPERWAKEIPDSRTYILPKVEHFPFEDAPIATIENFLGWWKDRFEPDAKSPMLHISRRSSS
jgi:haloalkane dehalogenase